VKPKIKIKPDNNPVNPVNPIKPVNQLSRSTN